jgi:SAM-dependent methyltransferase
MTASGYEYEGAEYLKLGEFLPNYNAAIAEVMARYADGERKVMDFGAGIGTLAAAVRKRGVEPLCLEPDAAQRAQLERLGFRTVASLDDVPDASLDYVYSSNVLEHIEDDVGALRALRAKLRAGGRLALYVPAFQSLYSSLDAAIGHYRRYDVGSLSAKLRDAGFTVDDLYYTDVLGYFVTVAFKRLGNSMSNANPFTMRLFDRCVFPLGRLLERLVRVPVGKNVVAVATRSAELNATEPSPRG